MTHIYRGIIMHYTFTFLFRHGLTFPRRVPSATTKQITNVSFSDQHLFPVQTLLTDFSSPSLYSSFSQGIQHVLSCSSHLRHHQKILYNVRFLLPFHNILTFKPMPSTTTLNNSSPTNPKILLCTCNFRSDLCTFFLLFSFW